MANKTLLVIFLFVLELMDMAVSAKKVKNLENLFCKTYETVVPVDPSNHGYYPFYVKLHRCAGSASSVSPKVQHCVANSYEELSIQVYPYSTSNFQSTTITMKNHTSCAHECVTSPDECDFAVEDWDDQQCACKCRYSDRPPKELACKAGFRWNSHKCKCECDRAPEHCSARKVWSNDICGCRCASSIVDDCTQSDMGIDVDCKCVDVQAFRDHKSVQSRNRMFITLLIGQGVLIILLICALVHWVRKRNQQNSSHSPLDRLDSCKTNDDLEVVVGSDCTDSLDDTKESGDNDSCTAPLSPKVRITNI